MKFRTAFDDLGDVVSYDTGLRCDPDDDRTIQSGKDDADINVILKRFGVSGLVNKPSMEPFYGDFTEVEDYQTALNRVLEADAAFAALPSDVRNRFNNEPSALIEFIRNDDNYEEAAKLGLLEPKPGDPVPQKVVVENWPAPPA